MKSDSDVRTTGLGRRSFFFVSAALAAGFFAGAVSSGVITAFAQERLWPKTLTAEKFVVVNSQGARRAEIGVDRRGSATLKLYGEDGRLLWTVPETGIWPAAPSQ